MTSPPRVSMEITDDMLKSMEVGLAFRDYVSSLSSSLQFIYASMVHDGTDMTLLLSNNGESSVGIRDLLSSVIMKLMQLLTNDI